MRPLSDRLVKKLRLKEAIENESLAQRNHVPPEPGWHRIGGAAGRLSRHIESLLRAGLTPGGQRELLARKPGHGVRPIAFWGPVERIVYRALTEEVMKPFPRPDRSPDAYMKFVHAPIARSFEVQREASDAGTPFFFHKSPFKYVIKSDITNFYQFIDHGVLHQELLWHGADHEATQALTELLEAVQGRSFGLPQMLDPSDWLSDVYIGRANRDLLRAGWEVWRYNDDFRITTRTYEEALQAIESLDSAARAIGLAISERKTVTYRFETYLFETLDVRAREEMDFLTPEELEPASAENEYLDVLGDEDEALKLVSSTLEEPGGAPDSIHLKSVSVEDVRRLRRATATLTAYRNPGGLPHMIRLIAYLPVLTPVVCRYVGVVAEASPKNARVFVDDAINLLSLNDWQRVWLLHLMAEMQVLAVHSNQRRREWVARQRHETRDEIVRCFASRALLLADALPLEEFLADADAAPTALLVPYGDALVAATERSQDPRTQRIGGAWRGQSVLHNILGSSNGRPPADE